MHICFFFCELPLGNFFLLFSRFPNVIYKFRQRSAHIQAHITMIHSAVQMADITTGIVLYQAPGNLIVPEVLTTQSLGKQQKDKHPILILAVNPPGTITITYLMSFNHAQLYMR